MTTLLKTLNFSNMDINSMARVSEKDNVSDDAKDEEINRLTNQIDILQSDLKSKSYSIKQMQDENSHLVDKNKKWLSKLDDEIEKNAEEV
jgi:predicted  nucleic acid-binding Zn-ribbon protein|tara:strand:- start:636 stop:905 length:270 start_codon:yes stop_codon:yes gene_type:complete